MTKSSSLLIGEGDAVWDGARLRAQEEAFRTALSGRSDPRSPVAIIVDNCPEWIAADLAAQESGIPFIPLPAFFTPAQWKHAIESSGAGTLICERRSDAELLGFSHEIPCDSRLSLYERRHGRTGPNLDCIHKITFTSGTTSQPKGVCLSADEQWSVAAAICDRISHLGIRRHLCLLPLSVLLENVGGVYAGMLCDATIACPPLSRTGLIGASRFDVHSCLEAIQRFEAESIILLPQMLHALVAAIDDRDERIRSLKFAAVGGAKTPEPLIRAARDKGIPVYEGYGLSECASVVSLNTPGADRIGSAGKPLPNREVRIAPDGEVEVRVSGRIHYLGECPMGEQWLPTGDIGHLDADGFLHVDGRKKNVLITAFGRNVSPEWPESAVLGTGIALQTMVLGDAKPYLIALIVPIEPQAGDEAIRRAIDQVNSTLPDYARIGRWLRVEPFTTANGLATTNGRLKRAEITERYRAQIDALYEDEESGSMQ